MTNASVRKKIILLALLTVFAWMVLIGGAYAADAVAFSGKVKKVIPDKHKVAIKDPETKKRFTIIVDEHTKLTGVDSMEDLKKGDAVSGHYVVKDGGKYMASDLTRK